MKVKGIRRYGNREVGRKKVGRTAVSTKKHMRHQDFLIGNQLKDRESSSAESASNLWLEGEREGGGENSLTRLNMVVKV